MLPPCQLGFPAMERVQLCRFAALTVTQDERHSLQQAPEVGNQLGGFVETQHFVFVGVRSGRSELAVETCECSLSRSAVTSSWSVGSVLSLSEAGPRA